MKKDKRWTGVVILLSLFLIWGQMPAIAGEEKAEFEAQLKTGFEVTGTSDLKKGSEGVRSRKVGEYKVMDEGISPTFEFSLSGNRGNDYLQFGGQFVHPDEQEYYLNVDFRRLVRQEFSYDRFKHWLDHDDLDNLNAVNSPADPHVVTTHTDYDSSKEYSIIHSETKSNTIVALPFIPGGQISFDYRRQERDGYRQALTMSKCTACHVQSHNREIHEVTQDYSPTVKAKFGKARSPQLAMEYSFLYRVFEEEGDTPTNEYDQALHPKTGGAVFDDRVWYQNQELEYDRVPDMEKYMHRVKAKGSVPEMNTSLFAGYVRSDVENTGENIETDSNIASVRISNTSLFGLIPGLSVNAGYRWVKIDNDDYLVDYTEPTGTNPVYTGTYQSYYGAGGAGAGSPPFTWPYDRESALSRESHTADVNARYTIMPGISMRLGFEWKKIDREDFLVEKGENETEQYTYKAGVNARLGPVRTRVRYTYQDIDDPFANSTANEQGGACEAFGTQAITGNPFLGLQYYEFWGTRTQDMSNEPDERHELVANVNIPISYNSSITIDYRWQKESTVSGEGQLHMPSINLWFAPTPKLSFNLMGLFEYQESESRICLPVFNG